MQLDGTAAVGAPLAGATVTAVCADGSGFTAAVATGAQGTWSGSVGANALPCALQIISGAVAGDPWDQLLDELAAALAAQPAAPKSLRSRALGRLHRNELERVHVHQPSVGQLERRDDRQAQERELQERLGHRAADAVTRRA